MVGLSLYFQCGERPWQREAFIVRDQAFLYNFSGAAVTEKEDWKRFKSSNRYSIRVLQNGQGINIPAFFRAWPVVVPSAFFDIGYRRRHVDGVYIYSCEIATHSSI